MPKGSLLVYHDKSFGWLSCLWDSKLTSSFCVPGRWVAESQILAFAAQAQFFWGNRITFKRYAGAKFFNRCNCSGDVSQDFDANWF